VAALEARPDDAAGSARRAGRVHGGLWIATGDALRRCPPTVY
jgi:hypothetical protein